MDRGLRAFNALPAPAEPLDACCGAPGWADAVAAGRPYPDRGALRAAADAALATAGWPAIATALADHPRIGSPPRGGDRRSAWSRAEQSAAVAGRSGPAATGVPVDDGEAARDPLVAGNLAYERRFGHVFLICASGRSRQQILAALAERLRHDEATERAVVRRELSAIAALRLDRLLSELAAGLARPGQRATEEGAR
ncbi:2-oxo-4-hydroxy-4-carboxy-5-ureidoimidazoline decarboxylase [Actinocatenispora sera]|uniref:2-oxo-4-hydroxy-4-carboxy-5-ureidoimidazoline decarboxylase n=1 Tax=Actinocatenispora sera TaxID=390989 RepID=A0A810LBY2_9ACTN|nr:2-oxo-4-hydroxy-4-carboxy-5-ureidoimidazoline decarboxylase [Actinocatenispora sera]BCJ31518.1 OHCU decarboxylase [Actinocatenispora sera]